MPAIPQIYPQKSNDRRITTGCNPKFSPSNFGSNMLPIMNWVADNSDKTRINKKLTLNCRNNIGVAATIAMTDPILGMKFKKNVIVANNSATSTLNINRIMNVINPKKDVKKFCCYISCNFRFNFIVNDL